jgi:hypothetical protein
MAGGRVEVGEVGGELVEGMGEGDLVIDATVGVAGAADATSEEETTKGTFGEEREGLGASPDGITGVEIMGTDGEGFALGAAMFEEESEVVIFTCGSDGIENTVGGFEAVGGPEQSTLGGPVEDGREERRERESELLGIMVRDGERDRYELETVAQRSELSGHGGEFGQGKPDFGWRAIGRQRRG